MLATGPVLGSSNQGPTANGFVSASNGLTGPPASQHSVWFGDFNSDNRLDIATAGYEGVVAWAGDGTGNWIRNSTGLPSSSYDGGICMGDFNRDGNLDIAAANYDYGSAGVTAWRGDGNGNWVSASAGLPNLRGHTGIFMADINHDNNLDIAVTSDAFETNPGGVKVYAGNGAGVWTSASTGLPASGKYYAVWMGDVNNDGDMDISASGPGLHVWLGNGAGAWTESSTGLPITDQWNSVTLGDLNLDGNLDLVSAMDMGGHGIKAWLGDGRGNWAVSSNGLPTTGLFYGVVLADLVGDKNLDILSGNYGGAGIKIFRGDGGNLWTDDSTGLPSGKVIGVAAGDINNDGYTDIGAVGEGFGVQVFENDAVVPPIVVTVVFPNGGENFEVATQQLIAWTAVGGTAPITIGISYSTTGVLGPFTSITTGETNDGTYTWSVPIDPSANCTVMVSATDSASRSNWDKSNGLFRIFLADPNPPTIGGLTPTDGFVTGDTTPTIAATYSDSSGIATAAVVLKVDAVNVTSSATVTSSDVTYVPSTPLTEGIHTAHVEVKDNYVSHNLATRSWQFSVDTSPPSIANLQPLNQSTVATGSPAISATYNDASGIDVASIVLKVDTIDVTASASVNSTRVFYVPSPPLANGMHNVSLAVADLTVPQNTATAMWWFIVDTTLPDPDPPVISSLQPANYSLISNAMPTIHAAYTDASGIDMASVVLTVDATDVTATATVTPVEVTFVPPSPLAEGIHLVSLVVRDASVPRNLAVAAWRFTVDTLPPIVGSVSPANESTITDTTPFIEASYIDLSIVDTSTVVLTLDSVDVTVSSAVFITDVSYTPASPLSLGRHDISLSLGDNAVPANTRTVTWWFIIDASPPLVENIQPANHSVTNIRNPIIGGDYSDPSGISLFSVSLSLDSDNVTSQATFVTDGFMYTPSSPLSEGIHTIRFEVSDESSLHHRAIVMWDFTVDSVPPQISDPQPANNTGTTDSTPTISAAFSDSSGIDVTGVMLRVDSIDVTSTATINQSGISFTMVASLGDGVHTVLLTVKDLSYPPNMAATQWSFRIDTTPPSIITSPMPSGLKAGDDVDINAEVTDISGIGSVTLHFRVAGTQQFDTAPMMHTTGSQFRATIPGGLTSSKVEYYIEANDTLGNVARRPSSNWFTSPYVLNLPGATTESGFPWVLIIGVVVIIVCIVVGIALYFIMRKKDGDGGEQMGEEKGEES